MENKTIADKPLTNKQAERAKAIDYLKNDCLKAGDTVYTILRHVSKSGMCRYIDLYAVSPERIPLRITGHVAAALDATYDRRKDSIRVLGVGGDVGFAAAYQLSRTLFGNGYALHQRWL